MREEKISMFMEEVHKRLDKMQGSIAIMSRIMIQLDIQNKVLADMALTNEEAKSKFKKTIEEQMRDIDNNIVKEKMGNKQESTGDTKVTGIAEKDGKK